MDKNSNILIFPSKINEAKPTRDKALLLKRIYAFTLDTFLIGILAKALIITYASFFREFNLGVNPLTQHNVIDNIYTLHLSLLSICFWGYFITSYYVTDGHTFGKLLFKLRVKSEVTTNTHLNFQEAFMRTLGYYLCYITGYLLFTISFFRKDGRGLPDFFSQTKVMTEESYMVAIESEQEELNTANNQLDLFDECA